MNLNFESLKPILETNYLNNSVQDYAWSVATLIGLLVIFVLIKALIVNHLKRLADKTRNKFDDTVVASLSRVKAPTFIVVSVYFATLGLELEPLVGKIVNYAFIIVVVARVVILIQDIFVYSIAAAIRKSREDDPGADTLIKNLSIVIKWGLRNNYEHFCQ